mgnify:CR=1 FL=1
MKYKVWNQDSEVVQGTKLISYIGDEFIFLDCKHPQRILTICDETNFVHEFSPSVFDVFIEEVENGSN